MRNEWLGVPEILMKKLFINAGVMMGVLITGIFMEVQQAGEGFLKLTLLCAAGLCFYFLSLCLTVFRKKYKTLEGEVIWIHILKGRKKYWEIGVTEDNGETKQLVIPAQDGVRKGKAYRFYYKNDDLLGVEEV